MEALTNVAPVFANGLALLGEVGKVTAMSTHRFESVSVSATALTVQLRGSPGERVVVAYCAKADGFVIRQKGTAVGVDGSAVLVLG